MRRELKKIIALQILDWSVSIMPDCEFKRKLVDLLINELLEGMP